VRVGVLVGECVRVDGMTNLVLTRLESMSRGPSGVCGFLMEDRCVNLLSAVEDNRG
jgi:hypothetical protein